VMLSLPEGKIGPLAPWSMSVGLPFFCLPLADREAVAQARFDLGIWDQVLPPGVWSRDVYAVAGDFAPGGTLKARMWAPADGVPEDPATGSAAAALAGSLAARLPDPNGIFSWTIEQGAELGRPASSRPRRKSARARSSPSASAAMPPSWPRAASDRSSQREDLIHRFHR